MPTPGHPARGLPLLGLSLAAGAHPPSAGKHSASAKCCWGRRGQTHPHTCCHAGPPVLTPCHGRHLPDGGLGDGAVHQRAEPPVQPPDAMVTDGLLHTIPCSRAQRHCRHTPNTPTALPTPNPAPPSASQAPRSPRFRPAGWGSTGHRLTDALVARRVCLLVQLQLRLHILGGECDADLDPSGQATWGGQEGTLGPGAAPCPSSTTWLPPALSRLSLRPLAARSGLGRGVPVLVWGLHTAAGPHANLALLPGHGKSWQGDRAKGWENRAKHCTHGGFSIIPLKGASLPPEPDTPQVSCQHRDL